MSVQPNGFLRLFVIVLTLLLSACGADTKPRMDLNAQGFFAFPWPNDMRKQANGSVDLRGFPANFNPIFRYMVARGETYVKNFGTNQGVFFQFQNQISNDGLMDWQQSLQDDAPVMLVNIDPSSPGYLKRIPLRMNFSPLQTLYKPANLLAVLPLPGYSLDPGAQYAAIVFTGVKDYKGNPIHRADMMENLDQGEAPKGVDDTRWNKLQQQWDKVQQYVSDHTAWRTDQVAAFTVYSTQNPTQYAFSVAKALKQIDDQTIIQSVTSLKPVTTCDGHYAEATFEGRVKLPTWQQGVSPYLFTGGFIVRNAEGIAQVQGVEDVPFYLVIGCAPNDNPRKVIVGAPGSGDDHRMALSIPGFYINGYGFNQIAISVAPHLNGGRAPKNLDAMVQQLKSLGINIDATDLGGFLYYNPLNPPASVGNQIQGAADYIYLRRLAVKLADIFKAQNLDPDTLPLPKNALRVDPTSAAIVAQSQGASNAPLAMAMDPTFNIGRLNAASSDVYPQAIHRGSVRQLMVTALAGMVENEINDFHPIMQVMQMAYEPADSVNFVPFLHPSDLLFTAGYNDGCVPREGSGPLGFALVRHGLVQLDVAHNHSTSFTDPYFYLSKGPGLPEVSFPLYDANMPDGHYGLFVELPSGHYGYGSEDLQSDFLAVTLGMSNGPIRGPFLASGDSCDIRVN